MDTAGKNAKKIQEYIQRQCEMDQQGERRRSIAVTVLHYSKTL